MGIIIALVGILALALGEHMAKKEAALYKRSKFNVGSAALIPVSI